MNSLKIKPWIITIIGSLFFLFAFAQLNLMNSLSQFLIPAWQITPMQLSLLSAIYLYGLASFFIPMGILLDHISTRKLMLFFMGVGIVVFFIFINSNHFFIAAATRFILGAVHAMAFLSSLRLAMLWLPHKKALAIGITITIGLSGGLWVQLPLTKLILLFGWRNALYLISIMGIIIWILMYQFLEDKNNAKEKLVPSPFNTGLEQLKLAIKNLQNWLCALYTCLLNLPLLIFGALWGNIFLTQTKLLTLRQASYINTLLFLGFIIGSTLIGWLADRFARRKIMMILGALISLIIFLFIVTQTSFLLLLILFFLLGIISSTQILSYAVISEVNPINVASTALSFASVIIMGGGALFQSLFSALIIKQNMSNTFDYTYGLYLLIFGFMVSFVVAVFVRRDAG